MIYKEQLETKEWKEKRKAILQRDNYHCQHCGTFGICGNNTDIILQDISQIENYITNTQMLDVIKTYSCGKMEYNEQDRVLNFEIWIDENCCYKKNIANWTLFPVITPNSIYFPSHYIFSRKSGYIKHIYETCIKQEPYFMSIMLCKDLENTKQTPVLLQTSKNYRGDVMQISYKNRSLKILDITKSFPLLDIHHKLYRLTHYAWEYEENELITLCRNCHEKEHTQNKILVFDENNRQIKNVHICDKCHGIGYIDKYSYYQEGICFACSGLGFTYKI